MALQRPLLHVQAAGLAATRVLAAVRTCVRFDGALTLGGLMGGMWGTASTAERRPWVARSASSVA